MSAVARGLVSGAAIVFGGKRHLALAAPIIRGAARPWPSPFDRVVEEVLAQRGRAVCVLASGDPFMHGVGAVLARHIDAQEMLVVPAPSAFSLAAARLGWALPETALVSLHARALDFVRPHLQPGARVIALTSDGAAPAALARLLDDTGFGGSRLIVLEALGGPRERMRATTAAAFDLRDVDALNTVAIEVVAAPGARVIPRTAGIADALFEHDGQITKREIRAVTLSALAPRRGELLWDIGAGAGSVAIEWMLADPSLRAVAIEARVDRAARIRRNAAAFGVPALDIVEGEAPAALANLAPPRRDLHRRRRRRRRRARRGRRGLASRRPPGRQCGDARDRKPAARAPRGARRRVDQDRCRARRAGRAFSSSAIADGVASGDAGDPMDVDKAMIVAGVGCRKGTAAAQIEAAIAAALARAGLGIAAVRAVATSAAKADEPGIAAAASSIGVPLVLVAQDDLAAAGARAATRSERVLALTGVPSVAEAAALAAGGPAARLIAPRIAVGPATCALADSGGGPCEGAP